MKRTILVAAVASAPLLAFAGHAAAQLSISTSTNTPVATATAVSNAPADIDITSSGSIGVTSPGVAVTLNSSNAVTNEGAIGFTDQDNSTGILIQGGNTGSVINTGTITVTESYSPALDTNNDGLVTGVFAMGTNRRGILVSGPGTLTGGIVNEGTITVHGNNSFGVDIEAPITGDYQSLGLVTAATATTDGVISVGSISIVGDNSVGLMISPTGGVGGSVQLTGINVTGVGSSSRGAVIDGPVGFISGGGINVSGLVSATGYRTTVRADNPAISELYTAQELSIGGSALTVGGSVAGGLLISAPPLVLSTTNLAQDNDNNGIPDNIQGIGTVVSYGSAPALQIGDHGLNASLGYVVSPTPANPIPGTVGYGLVIQGSVVGNGLFDQITSPLLPAPVSATAIQLGTVDVNGNPDSTVFIAGGIHNTGGVSAQSYQADATAIHFLSGAATPSIVNDGSIAANSDQLSEATTGTPQVNVNAILIEKGASVGSIVNSGSIVGNLSATGGVGGVVGAIVDRSGSVNSITNTGVIEAEITQTLITALAPGTLTAIDLSKGTGPQVLNQSVNAAFAGTATFDSTIAYTPGALVAENNIVYQALTASSVGVDAATNPSIWREVGALTPSIYGSVYFGSGGTTVNVSSGTIVGQTIDLGSGVNTVNISGANTVVVGSLLDEGAGTLTLNVASGLLSSTNPGQVQANSINVGATGILLAEADPLKPTVAQFTVKGASTFTQGAQVGINLASIQTAATETYIVIQAIGAGTISAGTFSTGGVNVAPFLYNEQANYVAATPEQTAEITVTAGLKTQSQLGFTNAEASALPAILAAAPNIPGVQSALLSQTTEAGLKSVYDQLLPSQGQGLFDALDKAAQSVSDLTSTTPDAGTRVAGSSLWLQEVNERVRRTGIETQGSYSKVLGIVGGYERMGAGGGAMGLTLAYYNAEESEDAQQIGGDTVASMVETGAYYRRALGGLTFAVRGAGGYAWFSSERRLVAPGATEQANSNWGGYFVDGHVGLAYEQRLGRFYARPQVSADYLRLHESSHAETGGDPGFDLNIQDRTSTRLSGEAVLVLGTQFGKAQWLRSEVQAGYREVFSGDIGDTVANFSGGSAFSLAPDSDTGGWATIGISLKGGSQYSYLALEGNADFRSGEQRYDLRIAGRSIF
jgi:hypothetical protein